MASPYSLPPDQRAQQGGLLFIASLLVFFVASIVMFLLYVSWRSQDFIRKEVLPLNFAASTICLVAISVLLHLAVKAIRREHRSKSLVLMVVSFVGSVIFLGVQGKAMWDIAGGYDQGGLDAGLKGMMLVLALLHALHVIGGVAALAIVTLRTWQNLYDHERHWGISFCAQYWHFLDAVWFVMLAAFLFTSGGFDL